ncbi:MAG: LptF/LptG family permease, partial [Roseobacter sp.]
MKTLTVYFSKVLAVRIVAVLCSLVALLVLMDLIDNVEKVLERRGSPADIAIFAGYRLPTIIERLIPLSVLVGSTMGVLALATRSELVVLRATGVSPFRIVALGLPVCLTVVGAHFLVADRIAPASERAFVEWWEPSSSKYRRLWLRGEDGLVRIGSISADATVLTNLDLFERDAAGVMISRTSAKSARYEDGRWRLFEVVEIPIRPAGTATPGATGQMWINGPSPQVLLDLVAGPEQLSNTTLEQIMTVSWSSSADPSVYGTELARRSAGPLASLAMMLIVASTVRGLNRSGGPQIGALVGLAVGLTFLIVDGIFGSLGRAGLIAPMVAAWTP